MITDSVDKKRHIEAYGIKCQPLARSLDISKASVNVTHCVLQPGSSTSLHQHREAETFFVLSGQGEVEAQGKTIHVGPGHTVIADPFNDHVLRNTSPNLDFEFLSIYSDATTIPQKSLKQVVIAAPPTPNGDLHLGHLGGPYLASDIYQRYLRLRNKQVFFLSGTDDFQNYVENYAEANGIESAQEVAEKFRTDIQKTLQMSGVNFDKMLHPHQDSSYQAFVADFFEVLHRQGLFEVQDVPTFFEKDSGKVVRESQIKGQCPSCDLVVVGNCCEECGYVGDVNTLKNPEHTSGVEIELRPLKRAVLNLKKYESEVRSFINHNGFQQKLGKIADVAFQKDIFYPITYPSRWGVKVQNADFHGQVVNVWVEMAASYVYLARTQGVPFLDYKKVSTSLFCGIDNAFYYAILIPIILQAYDKSFCRPYELHINEFWNLEGKKFSTSRKHAIWGQDFLRTNELDYLRFYMAFNRPLYERENFMMKNYEQALQTLQIKSLDSMIQSLQGISHIKMQSDLYQIRPELLVELQDTMNQYERNFIDTSNGLKQNAHLISNLILRVRDLHFLFQRDPKEIKNFIYALRILGALLMPYMPARAQSILTHFNLSTHQMWVDDLSLNLAEQEMQSFHEVPMRRAE